ncbi:diguanylate cyclase domain-containing protein [Azovibrio restrictus]|uniref:diguanylate cyclase domain-containing protein n=1 Tax=Azovibrio restrictus TaxID=146938 RepID=UPI0026EB253E|nr:diguanylate cyclase [Azovibrio restrictus]
MKVGMAPRLALILALLAVLASGLTGYYAYATSRRLLLDSAEKSLMTATQVLGERFLAALGGAAKDARLFASLARAPEPDAAMLTEAACALLETHPEYFQVRLIDARPHGLERIRVDRDGARITRVSAPDLQEKGHKLYVSQALRLAPEQVYLSKVFINREAGAHSGFERPTVIVAVPVSGRQGGNERLAVINVDLETLFDTLRRELPPAYRIYLANEWGDFLIHPDASKTFGFERGQRFLIQEGFPAAAAIVAGELERVVVNTSQGKQTLRPEVVAALARFQPTEFASQRFFILGLSESLDEVLRDNRELREHILRIVLVFSVLALFLAWLASRAVTRPLADILGVVRGFSRGEQQGKGLPLARRDEIGQLARGVRDMQTQIQQQLDTLESNRQAMAYLAHHDALTGLPNRLTFLDRLQVALAQARRQGHQLAVLFVDLDRFKEINDHHGHQVGDRLLQEVAHRLQGGVRESDTAARLSGDEFVVMLDPVQGREEVLRVADKLLQRFQAPLTLDGLSLPVRVSIGISLFPEHGSTAQALLEAADAAMYVSKAAGRNAWTLARLDSDD